MHRLLGLLLALAAVAAPASAQQRFVEACAASPDVQQLDGVDGPELCRCVAERTVARGIPAADLDRSIDYSADALATAPEEIRAVAAVAMESTVSCALGQQAGAEATAVADVPSSPESPDAEAAPAALAPTPATPPVVPTGLRTGDGTRAVRVEQEGKGGVIRIVGD
jgi:hypothetical protein